MPSGENHVYDNDLYTFISGLMHVIIWELMNVHWTTPFGCFRHLQVSTLRARQWDGTSSRVDVQLALMFPMPFPFPGLPLGVVHMDGTRFGLQRLNRGSVAAHVVSLQLSPQHVYDAGCERLGAGSSMFRFRRNQFSAR